MDFNWISETATMLGIGAIAYFLKDFKKSTEKQIQTNISDIKAVRSEMDHKINKANEDMSEKICKVDEKLDLFKEHVNRNFVDKESYIRNITAFDAKLDKITDLIMEMKGERKQRE